MFDRGRFSMAMMIPPFISPNAPPGEKKLFDWLSTYGDPDWIALHDQHISSKTDREAQVDFIVIVPGMGVLVIEVKSHHSVSMSADGQWVLGQQGFSRSPDEQARTAQQIFYRRLKETVGLDTPNFPIVGTVWFTHADFPHDRIDTAKLKTLAEPLDQHSWSNPRAAILGAIEQGRSGLVENRQKGAFQWSDFNAARPNRYDIEHIKGALLPLKQHRLGQALATARIPAVVGGIGFAAPIPPPPVAPVQHDDMALASYRPARRTRRALVLLTVFAFCVVAGASMIVLAVEVALS